MLHPSVEARAGERHSVALSLGAAANEQNRRKYAKAASVISELAQPLHRRLAVLLASLVSRVLCPCNTFYSETKGMLSFDTPLSPGTVRALQNATLSG